MTVESYSCTGIAAVVAAAVIRRSAGNAIVGAVVARFRSFCVAVAAGGSAVVIVVEGAYPSARTATVVVRT